MRTEPRIALIGGTGVDEIPGLRAGAPRQVTTRYGTAAVLHCQIDGLQFLFVPRHGLNHSAPPSAINYRAQIAALAKLGVKEAVGVCAVGALREEIAPGTFVVLRDFIDLTRGRARSFIDEPGQLAHTDFSMPYCPEVSGILARSCSQEGVRCRDDGVYVGVDGPRYETPAEVRLYASWGGDVVGMTNLPEAVLAHEAAICYGALAMVTNYASGLCKQHLAHEDVRAAMLQATTSLYGLITRALRTLPGTGCPLCTYNAVDLDS